MTDYDVLSAREVRGAKEWVNGRVEEGHNVCFLTTRPEKLRRSTKAWLESRGFRFHSLVMGKPNAESYHYIDDRHVQATTFKGEYASLVRRERRIEIFE